MREAVIAAPNQEPADASWTVRKAAARLSTSLARANPAGACGRGRGGCDTTGAGRRAALVVIAVVGWATVVVGDPTASSPEALGVTLGWVVTDDGDD